METKDRVIIIDGLSTKDVREKLMAELDGVSNYEIISSSTNAIMIMSGVRGDRANYINTTVIRIKEEDIVDITSPENLKRLIDPVYHRSLFPPDIKKIIEAAVAYFDLDSLEEIELSNYLNRKSSISTDASIKAFLSLRNKIKDKIKDDNE